MALRKQYKTDKDAEVNGIPYKCAANEDGSIPTFHLARMGGSNKAYQKAFSAEIEQYRAAIDAGVFTDEQAEQCEMNAFCKAVLKGWENCQMDPGENVEFSVDNALTIFAELPDLYTELKAKAKNFNSYKVATLQAVAKN
jgi:hypothetical protein